MMLLSGLEMDAHWEIKPAPWPVDLPAAAEAFAAGGELAWLDSTADLVARPEGARYSLLGTQPGLVIEQFDGRPATLSSGGVRLEKDDSAWRLWRRAIGRLPKLPALPQGLSPGWVGYIGFEMARQLERLPASHHEDLGLPLVRLALFERAILLDHQEERAFAVRARDCGTDVDDGGWVERWADAAEAQREFPFAGVRVQPEITPAAHRQAVARALEYIAAGDIYQVNLAQRFRLAGVTDVLATYAAIRRANPAPYAALLRWDGGAVASFSPELFLQLHGDQVLTRPIKGTRPRTGDPPLDEVYRRELLGSAKEAAELTMIVDLHRNDLGRVCRFGSVRVEHPRRVEAHPTVFHTVADVNGRLAPEHDALDLLEACFPAGSISGVPKIRALQIIDELEPVARGVYTGAIGVLGLDGQMTFNVAIRTLQVCGQAATLYVGGGIVADSDPAAEYAETLAKARGILIGLTCHEPQAARV